MMADAMLNADGLPGGWREDFAWKDLASNSIP
jgi:hypothetical protein